MINRLFLFALLLGDCSDAAAAAEPPISEGEIYRGVELTDLAYAEVDSLPASLRLNPNEVMDRPVGAVLGFNWNWWRSDEIAFPAKTIELNPELSPLLAPLPMRGNRATGSFSQVFEWQASTGPRDQRPHQTKDYFTPGPSKPIKFGLPEWIKTLETASPDFRISWVLNMITDDAQDAANLAAYLTLPADNDHLWSRQRVADGIVAPVVPYVWELGNEMDHNRYSEYDEVSYAIACREWMAAVRAIQPDAKFAATIRGSPSSIGPLGIVTSSRKSATRSITSFSTPTSKTARCTTWTTTWICSKRTSSR